MKVSEYRQMMAYLTRPAFNGGGSVKNKTVLPKKKPEEEVKKRKIKNFEKAKPALENPKEVKEMIDKPKRGLVDEPGSYSVTAKEQKNRSPFYSIKTGEEQKNIDAWNKRFKKEIKEGLIEPYEKQSRMSRYYIRQGVLVGLNKTLGFDNRPVELRNKKLFDKIVSLGKEGKTALSDISNNPEVLKLNNNKPLGNVTVKEILQKELGNKKVEKILNLSTVKKLKSTELNKVFSNIIKNNPNIETIGELAKAAQKQLNKVNLRKEAVLFVKDNKLNIVNLEEKIFPEIKALDKIIKDNRNNFETIQKGVRSTPENFRNTTNSMANLIRTEMRKQFPNISNSQIKQRIIKLNKIYLGKTQYELEGEYKKIKPPKNYKNSSFFKGLYATVKAGGFQIGVAEEARLLGLPQKDIDLLDDVTAGGSKLSKVKLAGDHTDSAALMKAVYGEKDFAKYKKDFMRINLIANELNTQKSIYDKRISDAYKNVLKGIINENQFNEIVSKTKKELFKKTKIPIGDPQFINGKFEFNFATERLGDIDHPRNAAIKTAANNLVKQSNVKFKGIDQKLRFAETPTERFNILKEASLESLKKSKFLKSFSAMKGNVGQAAKSLLSSKFGKYGVLPTALYTAATTVANADEPDTAAKLVDEVALTKGATGFPTKTEAGVGLAAATAGTKTGRSLFGKAFKGFGKAFLPLGTPTGTYQFAKNLFFKPTLESIEKGEKIKSSPLQNFAIDVSLPISAVAPTSQALNLFGPSKGGFFKRTAKDIAKTALGGGYVPRGIDRLLQKIGLQSKRLGPGVVSRFIPNAFRFISPYTTYAAPVVETAIQGYNAYKRLQEAKEKYGMDDTVTTALGPAPRKYVQELISELPEVDRSGAAGGGIMKMAGKSSGPAPESGPTPQGLDFLMKRGRQY